LKGERQASLHGNDRQTVPSDTREKSKISEDFEFSADGELQSICLMSYIRYDRFHSFRQQASQGVQGRAFASNGKNCNRIGSPRKPTRLVKINDHSYSEHPSPAFSPLYRQIKSLILQRLEDGDWKPGEMIPSEIELASQFKVSQGTVRKAIDELGAENLVIRRQGKGTFVATHTEQHVQYRFLRLAPDVGDPGTEGPAQRRVLECRRIRATSEVARALGLRTGDAVLHARRLLSFTGVPTILEDLWLPGAAFKGLTADRMAQYPGPTYALFELEFGVRMVRAAEKLRAVAADSSQAQALDIPVDFPLLSVERIAYTYSDTPMEFRQCVYRTDTHHYRNDLS
jgi:GntR family transcriptional regulator